MQVRVIPETEFRCCMQGTGKAVNLPRASWVSESYLS